MTTELVTIESDHQITLFGTDDPLAVIDQARRLATPLAALIDERQLFTDIRGRKHVRIEGWTLLGSMLGVFPVTVWTKELENGWEARVEARTRAGEIVGAAEAECRRSESTWASRDSYALRSMAQTRAASKALRLPLGFVMQLGGFDPTPAEEMDGVLEGVVVSQHPCPSCGVQVADQRGSAGERQPKWKCLNTACEGGGKKKDGKGSWPWASWEDWPWDPTEGEDRTDDAVEKMYRLVTSKIGDRDRAEAVVFEAATELGHAWPDQGLSKDELNAVFKAAVARARSDEIVAFASAPLGELVKATIAAQEARIDTVVAAADEAGLTGYPMLATPKDKAGWVELTEVFHEWARGLTA